MPLIYKIDVLQALKEKGYNTNTLRKERLLSESTIQNLRESQPISWSNISRICDLLGCQPNRFLESVKEPETVEREELSRLEEAGRRIRENMAAFNPVVMLPVRGFIRLERTLPDGSVRRGIVGKIDLEAYDYSPGSVSPVRATEKTVLERIPPRMRVRAEAKVELPHILILADDRTGLFDFASALPGSLAYDFSLMQGGGSLRGWRIEGHEARRLTEKIAEYKA